ncbi:ATP-binding protein [Litorilinea aerophila]|uniref:ATP-binding protein n=1 Tax=Litorilinea aerophila TaxID=1204385 RepID=UPI001B877FEC|nr:ATP-binding protein [Litorilinea aerophila]MCC9078587.1 ATP-binding protein [Litorilinea aerophila]
MNTPTSSSAESSGQEPATSRSRRPAATQEDACPICKGTGYVVPDLPIGHPDFGKAVPCRCQAQARLEKRLRRLQTTSNLAALKHLTFERFIPEPAHLPPDKVFNLRRAYDTCVYFAQNPEGWLLLTGTYGCGKTHLAAAIANARLAQGEAVLFMIVPDLLDHLRATFNPQSEVSYDSLFEQLRTVPLLILDDLGTQSSTPWAQEKLFQLLNYRYNAQLPTVITTNQRLEELEPRLRSRLADPSLVKHFHILAPDFRTGRNASQSELSTLNLHRDQRFENFDPRRNDLSGEERLNLQKVFAICQNYAQEPRGWLVLSGTYGCGKTHLAAAIANYQVEHAQGDVMFIVVPDLLDHLRAAFSPQSTTPYDRRFDEIKKVPMLVLDDLGTESATPWAREKLFQLLNYRYNALLPTVITTSSPPERIEPWLRTRMFDTERCQFCGIIAPGYRGSRSQQESSAQRRGRRSR